MSTLPVSAAKAVRFTPQECEGQEAPPVYLIKPATFMERAEHRRSVTATGARFPGNREMFGVLREVLEAAEPDNLDELLEVVAEAEQVTAELGGSETLQQRDPQLQARLAELEGIAGKVPAYAELSADRSHYLDVALWWAARRFLIGGENVPDMAEGEPNRLRRRHGLVAEEDLEALPTGHLEAIGYKALELMQVRGATAKN